MGRSIIGRIVEHPNAARKLCRTTAILCLAAIVASGCDAPTARPPQPPPAPTTTIDPASAAKPATARPGVPDTGAPAIVKAATPCQAKLKASGVPFARAAYEPQSPEGHPQLVCGVDDPVWVSGTVHGVRFLRGKDNEPTRMLASCELAVALGKLARQARRQGIAEVIHAGTTNCRTIGDSDRLSQHAYGRAIDVLGFRTDRRHTWSVSRDWEKNTPRPRTDKGKGLKEFAQRMHEDYVFNIVLTPDYDAGHQDHFHLDLTPDRHFLSRGPADLLLGD